MKSISDDTNGSNNSWLGFSLSPHMKMEVNTDPHHQYHHHHSQPPPTAVSNAIPTSFYLSSSPINTTGICYGDVGENGAFHSPLSVMPLKSDGSLCIMEALTRSQPEGLFQLFFVCLLLSCFIHSFIRLSCACSGNLFCSIICLCKGLVASSSPKLEDFLGGATMETHQYGSHERETMALSLDSIYYHQNAESETSRQHSLDLLQEQLRQQDQQFNPVQTHPYYLGMPCHGMYQAPLQEETKNTHLADCESQLPQIGNEAMPCFKNWVSRHYCASNALEQQMSSAMVDGGASGSVSAIGVGDLQSLSLSMSPGSQSSCITAPRQISPAGADCVALETKKRGHGKVGLKQPVHRKSIDTFGQRTSQYRGVTRLV